MRSLTSTYKQMMGILRNDNSTLAYEHLERVKNGFNTLHDPITRARYLIELQGIDVDVIDNRTTDVIMYAETLRQSFIAANTIESITELVKCLKEDSNAILDELETAIDHDKDYTTAMGLICKFYEIFNIYPTTIAKLAGIESGKIIYVNFS